MINNPIRRISLYESFACGIFTALFMTAAAMAFVGWLLGSLRPLLGLLMSTALLCNALMLVSAWVWFCGPYQPIEKGE